MSLTAPAVTRVQAFMARSAGEKAVAWSPSSSRACGSKPKAADCALMCSVAAQHHA
ncbi:hypothetical protein HZU83_20525 [Sphaerotilus montanus]|uniref:Phage-related protein n=1 Tax=Sphaerotilus montanus TaxID=522889 RepID=A0A7Y9QW76_9BURK|nr:hypothetical protein [Sphaerotilus montanus]NYG32571.1 phage-related protein [Sphaerotilus montanus]NZD59070.1 hypothetical protein [Sphaerotilus montanus]